MGTNFSFKDLTPDSTIEEITSQSGIAKELLSSIGLSIQKHKSESLRSVCQQLQWSEVEVLNWLEKNQLKTKGSDDTTSVNPDYGNNLKKWCNYVEQNYIEKNSVLLDDAIHNFNRVHKVHGNQYVWLKHIKWHVENFQEKLEYYLSFQKERLFPLIKELKYSKDKMLHGTVKNVKHGLEIVEKDQKKLLDKIDFIEEKIHSVKISGTACSTLRILNHDFNTLFSSVQKQIELEQKHIYPLAKQKLESG